MPIFLFFFGCCVGSLINVIVDRLERDETFISGRSYCEHCRHILAWFDLVPLLSFVLLKGKCRYCHKKLSLYYPIVELTTGVLFALTYLALEPRFLQENMTMHVLSMLFYFYTICSLIIIFFSDLKYGIIPFRVAIPGIVITIIFLIISTPSLLLIHLLAAIGAGVFFYLLYYFTHGRGMGFGDVVYALLMGLLLGSPGIILGLYIAFLTGSAIALILILSKRKKLQGSTIPFGPFLVAGTWAMIFFNNEITLFAYRLLHLR